MVKQKTVVYIRYYVYYLKNQIDVKKINSHDLEYYQADNRWLNFILDSADLTIISTDTQGIIRSINHTALKKLGYRADELIGIHTPEIIHDADEIKTRTRILSEELGRPIGPGIDVFIARVKEGGTDENEWAYVRKDGSRFPIILTVTALRDDEGHIEGYLGIGRDISLQIAMKAKIELQQLELERANAELKEANLRLSEMIDIDPLTELYNRRGLQKGFEQEMERVKRHFTPLSLLLMDVDYFKSYNDEYGHMEGDNLLRELSHMLKTHSRTLDCAARFGGEEFIVLLPETDSREARVIAERYRSLIEAMETSRRPVTASFGIASLTHLGEEVSMSQVFDRLMTEADEAMYKAKSFGRNCVMHYNEL